MVADNKKVVVGVDVSTFCARAMGSEQGFLKVDILGSQRPALGGLRKQTEKQRNNKTSPTERSKRMRIISNKSRKSSQGFTLIEMIGVLAVIAILASMLVPKIFEAINSSRINNAVQSYNAIKTAVMDHYGKFGAINYNGRTQLAIPAGDAQLAAYDRVLLQEGLIDKVFAVKVGTNALVRVVAPAAAATTAADGANAAYDLDGDAAFANDAFPATFVVEAVIQGVAIADAVDISQRLDGAALSNATGSAAQDIVGRVKYAAPVAAGDPVAVHIYIAHR